MKTIKIPYYKETIDIHVAEENLKALITGSGTVYYNGNPKIKKNAIGVGKVLPLGGVKVE